MIAPVVITTTGTFKVNSDGENPGPALLLSVTASPNFSGSWVPELEASSNALTYTTIPYLDRMTGKTFAAGVTQVASRNIEVSGNNYRAVWLKVVCNIGSLTVQPIQLAQATPATVKTALSNIDLTKGIPVGYPDTLAFQFQLAADQQGS